LSRISALWGNVFKEKTNERSVAAVLRRIPVFSGLSKSEMKQVEKIIYLRTYQEGEVIFVEGEPGAGMYVIESGKIRICLGPNTDEEHEIAMLENGDFFGELALIDDHPRSATAVAVASTRLIGFFRSELISIISRSPRLGVKLQQNMMQILVKRLRITDQRLHDCNELSLELQQKLDARSNAAAEEQAK